MRRSGQVAQVLADVEVIGIVDNGFRPQGPAFLVVLLDAGSFVVDVQRGDHSIGDDPGTKRAGRGLRDPTIEDELNLFGTADVQVFSDNVFKEDTAAYRLIQNLGEGKFELENGELITISRLTVLGGEGMGPSFQPFAE
jgi:hypothetical protein